MSLWLMLLLELGFLALYDSAAGDFLLLMDEKFSTSSTKGTHFNSSCSSREGLSQIPSMLEHS